MFSLYGLKMNNEQSLFKNKIITNDANKNITNIKPKILFRNDALNNIINGKKNSYIDFTEDKILSSEDTKRYINKSNYTNNNNNLNSFKKINRLKLPSLSEKSIKINDLINNKKKVLNFKIYEELFNDNINSDDKRKRYINNIMQSCCSVVKMNIPKKNVKDNNKECFICYKSKSRNKSNNYKPTFLYKNKGTKIKVITNKYKRIQYMPSKSLNKNIKLLISEETMTSNNKKNCKNKNKDNDKNNYLDYLISTKKFDKYNSKKQNVHLNTYNFNYDEYCKNVKD